MMKDHRVLTKFPFDSQVNQIKTALEKKAYDDAGLQQPQKVEQPAATANTADVTLNALNSVENDVDVEGAVPTADAIAF